MYVSLYTKVLVIRPFSKLKLRGFFCSLWKRMKGLKRRAGGNSAKLMKRARMGQYLVVLHRVLRPKRVVSYFQLVPL